MRRSSGRSHPPLLSFPLLFSCELSINSSYYSTFYSSLSYSIMEGRRLFRMLKEWIYTMNEERPHLYLTDVNFAINFTTLQKRPQDTIFQLVLYRDDPSMFRVYIKSFCHDKQKEQEKKREGREGEGKDGEKKQGGGVKARYIPFLDYLFLVPFSYLFPSCSEEDQAYLFHVLQSTAVERCVMIRGYCVSVEKEGRKVWDQFLLLKSPRKHVSLSQPYLWFSLLLKFSPSPSPPKQEQITYQEIHMEKDSGVEKKSEVEKEGMEKKSEECVEKEGEECVEKEGEGEEERTSHAIVLGRGSHSPLILSPKMTPRSIFCE